MKLRYFLIIALAVLVFVVAVKNGTAKAFPKSAPAIYYVD